MPEEKLSQKLAEVASRHVRLLEWMRTLQPDDPRAQILRTEAAAAVADSQYDRAEELLAEAESMEDKASALAEQAAHQALEAANARSLNSAAIRAARGDLAMTRLDYIGAAAHFETAAQKVPPAAKDKQAQYRRSFAAALYFEGYEKGDNAALKRAIDVLQALVFELDRGRESLVCAETQTDLGAALLALGELEGDAARFEAAAAVCRAVLEEFTRERAPLQWALAQLNLGGALLGLGQLEGDAARFEAAAAALRAALEEFTRERAPRQWTLAQASLGFALQSLGEYLDRRTYLEQALDSFNSLREAFEAAGQTDEASYFSTSVIPRLKRYISERQGAPHDSF